METTAPLAVGGNRLRWAELPGFVRETIEAALADRVVAADSKEGGFSPGLASVLTLASGATVFAKAVSLARNEFTVAAIRNEADVLRALPPTVPAPRLRWSYDDGEWVVLVTEAVDGHTPAQPWRRDELARFLDATTVLARSLTPSPIAAPKLADDAEFHVDGWPEATEGTALLHGDLRADNFLLTRNGFTVVDWPSVCVGPPWIDLLFALPSVAMHGGGDPQELWSAHPLGRDADPDAVDVALAGLAHFFLTRAKEPTPPLLPTIRQFQQVQGEITTAWLAARRRN
ncbi:MAG TPA: phosphotransferase [Candidatus Limnocylindrales bacterium]|nr:phosphotransferase [Candidatus Limnocylindrales bacterium]